MKMKEHPILFSGPMVKALLEGRKTQTRRAVRWPWKRWPNADELDNLGDMESLWVRGKKITCPYGQPGDRLWVRETWLIDRYDGSTQYAASHPCPSIPPRWKPSIHMPRARCRLVLEVTGVRVERVQEIGERDAIAEGADPIGIAPSFRDAYRILWDSLNAKRGYGWDKNPLVWVLEFRRIEQQQERIAAVTDNPRRSHLLYTARPKDQTEEDPKNFNQGESE